MAITVAHPSIGASGGGEADRLQRFLRLLLISAGTKQLVDLGGVACDQQANDLQQQHDRKDCEHRDADGPEALGNDERDG